MARKLLMTELIEKKIRCWTRRLICGHGNKPTSANYCKSPGDSHLMWNTNGSCLQLSATNAKCSKERCVRVVLLNMMLSDFDIYIVVIGRWMLL